MTLKSEACERFVSVAIYQGVHGWQMWQLKMADVEAHETKHGNRSLFRKV